jgi:excisionase family DNA binding protein
MENENLLATGKVTKALYSRKECAKALGVSVPSVDCLIRRGVLKAVKIGKRVGVKVESLVDMLQNGYSGRIVVEKK